MRSALQELRQILEIDHPGERIRAGLAWIDEHVHQCSAANSLGLATLALVHDPEGLKRWAEEDVLRRLGREVADAAEVETYENPRSATLDRVWRIWVLR